MKCIFLRIKVNYFIIFAYLLTISTMKKVQSRAPHAILALILFAAFVINGFATYFDYAIIPIVTKVVSILILLTFYYLFRKHMESVFLTIFLLFFLGDLFSAINFGEMAHKLSKAFYLGSYLLLIFVLMGKLKHIKYEGVVSIYLVLVLLLNSYFLYLLFGMVKENFSDNVNLVLYICHGVTLMAMAFLAFAVYLSNESRQSIIFLVLVFSFVFSDVLKYICNLYVYYWIFEYAGNMLHLASLSLLYLYVYNRNTSVNNREAFQESFVIRNSEKITA